MFGTGSQEPEWLVRCEEFSTQCPHLAQARNSLVFGKSMLPELK